MFEWGIESLNFSGGEEIPVEAASTFIIIGPNNSGKSTALREIASLINNQAVNSQVIKTLKRFLKGDEEDYRKWLENHFPSYSTGGYRFFFTKNAIINEIEIIAFWNDIKTKSKITYTPTSDAFRGYEFLFRHLDTRSRLSLVDPVPSRGALEPPDHYIHVLQKNEATLEKISSEVKKAFQKDLVINWGGGSAVWFHVGIEPERTTNNDRVSLPYLEELQKLPRLENEGDGIRSFVGTLLACYCGAQPVLLIDEPEVFLHPPQVRRLAGFIAKNAEEHNRQIILATHSSDVIQGALASSKHVTICRITRDGNINHATLLTQRQIEELWSKPLLRSAAAIDGVFHEGVIVCEADSDSRIYEALLRQVENEGRVQSPNDFYFIHGGGKGELATIARVYMSLGVKVAVVADFDILRRKGEFEKLFTSLRGNFSSIEAKYNATVSALSNIGPRLSLTGFIKEAKKLLGELESELTSSGTSANASDKLSPPRRKELSSLLEDTGDWSEAKKYGITKLKGGAYQVCNELLEECNRVGLFIVPYGELESWWRAGSGDKNEWFVQAIDEIANNPTSFREAADFMADVCKYLNNL